MAKIQLSMEELLQLVRGEMNAPELKEHLAKSLLDVWTRDETRALIEARGAELAQKKMERMIDGCFQYEKGWYGRADKLSGWAVPLIREEIAKATLPLLIDAIKPELEKVVSELVKKEFGEIFLNLVKGQAINE